MPRFFDVTRTRLRGAGPRVGRWGRSPSQPPRFAASRPLLPFAVARLRRFAAAAPLRGRPASPRSRPQRSLGSSASSPLRGRCSPSQPPGFAASRPLPLHSRPASPLRGRCSPSQPPDFAASRPLLPLLALRLGRPWAWAAALASAGASAAACARAPPRGRPARDPSETSLPLVHHAPVPRSPRPKAGRRQRRRNPDPSTPEAPRGVSGVDSGCARILLPLFPVGVLPRRSVPDARDRDVTAHPAMETLELR